jgi:hypothetical protein
MLGHALFHTYELSMPVFVVVAWLDAFSTTPATLGLAGGLGYGLVGLGALGATLAGGLLTYTGTTTLFVVLAGLAAGALLLCLRVVTAH